MSRTTATHNPSSMYDWSKPFTPNRCAVCGRPQAPAGSDWASQWYANTYAPLMDNLARMWGNMAQPWMAPATSAYAPLMDNLTRMWGNMAQTWTMPVPNPTWPGMGTRAQRHTHHHDCGCE